MRTLDLRPTFPTWLAFSGEDQTLRRQRETLGLHRTWRIIPRYGTGDSDRWTVIGNPVPADGNPASEFEDGQYASLADAREAQRLAELFDDGTHQH